MSLLHVAACGRDGKMGEGCIPGISCLLHACSVPPCRYELIVKLLQAKLPAAQIALLALFPRVWLGICLV